MRLQIRVLAAGSYGLGLGEFHGENAQVNTQLDLLLIPDGCQEEGVIPSAELK